MTPRRLLLHAVLVALAVCTSHGAAAERTWTDTDPPINATHVFRGETNRAGKPTGFHARPLGVNPQTARIVRIRQAPNGAGVYTAQVEIQDPRTGTWQEKFSTFFPDRLSHAEVISAILHAYRQREPDRDAPWSGPSGLGFPIQGYTLRDGRINTAYPVYIR
jgi:hypothetical protein